MGTLLALDNGELRVPIVSSYLHGYALSFRIWFEGELDDRNWVWDFGGMKRAKGRIDGLSPKAWMESMFDHTTIIADNDPHLYQFQKMNTDGIIQLRILPAVGAEQFAKYIFGKINTFVLAETKNRVKVVKVEVYENERNSASYEESVETLVVPKVLPPAPVWVTSHT
jgi:6-pyruvoyltetrahydropterin/6-carboxytetrahydropterin synthase